MEGAAETLQNRKSGIESMCDEMAVRNLESRCEILPKMLQAGTAGLR
jgi:hypothetical protein